MILVALGCADPGPPQLIVALKARDEAKVVALLEAGADANTRDQVVTPLSYAASEGQITSMNALIAHGANVNARNAWFSTTPLIEASMHDRAKAVQVLLAVPGIEIDTLDHERFTALTNAAQRGHAEVVRLLIDAGANLDLISRYGTTPIMEACEAHHPDVARLLAERGARLDVRDPLGTVMERSPGCLP